MFTENFFDHGVERSSLGSSRVPNKATQTLEISRGVSKSVDVIDSQTLQSAFRDEFSYQAMNCRKGAGIFHPQSGQRIDVEETPIIDVAGSEPPMRDPVMLAFQEVMQR